jgi:predicted RNA binding protein YcfA (HicA-like mRNA interferase family)
MAKIPRDISGKELLKLLNKYDYKITRRTGSHIRLTSTYKGIEHKIDALVKSQKTVTPVKTGVQNYLN